MIAAPEGSCATCGAQKPRQFTHGPLTVQIGPRAAWWRGKPLPHLHPAKHAILYLLCEHEKVDHFALQMVGIGPDADPKALSVQIAQLRRQLPREVQILSIRGWGYQLSIAQPA